MPLDIPCPKCGSLRTCACLPPGPADTKPRVRQEVIKMRREKRGGGREIVILEGFHADVRLDDLARELKKRCGTGGTVKGPTIEIQGDHRDAIAAFLLERGFRSKRAGG
ncbi:MAG: translation initiation factor [Planctomycetes bacterium]|nr:translation initiation factor [Planctomycetota bacterium]